MMNFILKVFELLKMDPKTAISKYLIGSGILLKGIGHIAYTYQDEEISHTFTYSDGLDITGYILILIGVALLVHRYFTIKDDGISLVYGKGIENMDIHIPVYSIPKFEQFDCIKIDLEEIDSYNKESVIENYHFNKKLIENRIEMKKNQKEST